MTLRRLSTVLVELGRKARAAYDDVSLPSAFRAKTALLGPLPFLRGMYLCIVGVGAFIFIAMLVFSLGQYTTDTTIVFTTAEFETGACHMLTKLNYDDSVDLYSRGPDLDFDFLDDAHNLTLEGHTSMVGSSSGCLTSELSLRQTLCDDGSGSASVEMPYMLATATATVKIYVGEAGFLNATGEELPTNFVANFTSSGIQHVAYSPDNSVLASAGGSGAILWDANTLDQIMVLTGENICDQQSAVEGPHCGVAFSSDGALLASTRASTASEYLSIDLWSTSTGDLSASVSPSTTCDDMRQAGSPTFSPDGSALAGLYSCGVTEYSDVENCGYIILWDTSTWEQLMELNGTNCYGMSVAFSADGSNLLASASYLTANPGLWVDLILWDAVTGSRLVEIASGDSSIAPQFALAFSPDGAVLASGGEDSTVNLWDATTGEAIMEPLRGHAFSINSLAFSSEGTFLVSASSDGTMMLWDPVTGERCMDPLTGHTGPVNSVSLSADDLVLASGSSDSLIKLWNVGDRMMATQEGAVFRSLAVLEGWYNTFARPVALSFDGTVVITAEGSGGSGRRRRQRAEEKNGEEGQYPVAFNSLTGEKIWDLETGPLGYTTFMIAATKLSPDGTMLAFIVLADPDGGYSMIVDATTGETIVAGPNIAAGSQLSDTTPHSIAFSPDSATFAVKDICLGDSAHCSPGISLVDASTGKMTANITTDPGGIVLFAPGGDILASGSTGSDVLLWETSTWGQTATLAGHAGDVASIAFSPGGTVLASGSSSGEIIFWDPKAGLILVGPIAAHAGTVTSVTFSPDGKFLASGSAISKEYATPILLWDAATGRAMGSFGEAGADIVFLPAFQYTFESEDSSAVFTSSLQPDLSAAAQECRDLFDSQYCAIYDSNPPYTCTSKTPTPFLTALASANANTTTALSVLVGMAGWFLTRRVQRLQEGAAGKRESRSASSSEMKSPVEASLLDNAHHFDDDDDDDDGRCSSEDGSNLSPLVRRQQADLDALVRRFAHQEVVQLQRAAAAEQQVVQLQRTVEQLQSQLASMQQQKQQSAEDGL